MSLELDSVHDQIAELCRRHGIAELSVFGSVARGEDRPDSDVDLISKGNLHWVIRDHVLAEARNVYAA